MRTELRWRELDFFAQETNLFFLECPKKIQVNQCQAVCREILSLKMLYIPTERKGICVSDGG